MNNINTKELWNEYYNGLFKFSATTMYVLLNLIPHGSAVIDIGCGRGDLMKRLKATRDCQVYGLDISDVAIKKLQEKGFEGEVKDIENLDDFEKIFHISVLSHTLEHVTNDDNLIKNCRRITNRYLLVAVPMPDAKFANAKEHVRIYNKEMLTALLLKHFSSVEDFSVSPHLILKANV